MMTDKYDHRTCSDIDPEKTQLVLIGVGATGAYVLQQEDDSVVVGALDNGSTRVATSRKTTHAASISIC